ncbi:MAG: glycosyltransferase family 2 protein [Acidimicrobiia bacterium]|nr:glycosyltransferase family 2 protein [Acidimicrobiia bacterium]
MSPEPAAPRGGPPAPNGAAAGPELGRLPRFPSLTFFFPMWNEEEIIERTVAAAHEAGAALMAAGEVEDYEILLVDDASTDSTGARADAMAAWNPRVRVVHHAVNRKLGGSLKTGLAEARGALVLYTDADLPFDLLDVVRACRLLRIYEADVVAAYRLDRTGEGPRRALYSYAYNALVRAVFRLRIRDVNFAFKLIRREVLEAIELHSEGSFIDAELLCRAQAAGFQIIQFGVDYFPRSRGVSTLSSGSVIVKILAELRELYPELRRARREGRRGASEIAPVLQVAEIAGGPPGGERLDPEAAREPDAPDEARVPDAPDGRHGARS